MTYPASAFSRIMGILGSISEKNRLNQLKREMKFSDDEAILKVIEYLVERDVKMATEIDAVRSENQRLQKLLDDLSSEMSDYRRPFLRVLGGRSR